MQFEIGGKRVGPREPLFVIAELGLNHDGSVDRALEMVDAAATAGASAVKLQTFRAEELVAAECPPPAHVPETSLRDFFRRFELDRSAHVAIAERARARGLAFIATPFSTAAVEMLEDIGVDAIKIASVETQVSLLFDQILDRAVACAPDHYAVEAPETSTCRPDGSARHPLVERKPVSGQVGLEGQPSHVQNIVMFINNEQAVFQEQRPRLLDGI